MGRKARAPYIFIFTTPHLHFFVFRTHQFYIDPKKPHSLCWLFVFVLWSCAVTRIQTNTKKSLKTVRTDRKRTYNLDIPYTRIIWGTISQIFNYLAFLYLHCLSCYVGRFFYLIKLTYSSNPNKGDDGRVRQINVITSEIWRQGKGAWQINKMSHFF